MTTVCKACTAEDQECIINEGCNIYHQLLSNIAKASPRFPLTTLRRLMFTPPLSLPDTSSLSLKLASVSGGLVTFKPGVDNRLLDPAWLLLAPPDVCLPAAEAPIAAVEAALAGLPCVKDSARLGAGLGCLGWDVGPVNEE